MDKRKYRFSTKAGASSETPGPEMSEGSRPQLLEKAFRQVSGDSTAIEVYKVRILLKSKRFFFQSTNSKSATGLDIPLAPEKEKELLAKYNVTLNDRISYEIFLKIYNELSADPEDSAPEATSSEYGLLFLSLLFCVTDSNRKKLMHFSHWEEQLVPLARNGLCQSFCTTLSLLWTSVYPLFFALEGLIFVLR